MTDRHIPKDLRRIYQMAREIVSGKRDEEGKLIKKKS
jgi:hypothetical protein